MPFDKTCYANVMFGISERVTEIIGGAILAVALALGVWCGILHHQRNSARSALKACQDASAATVANFRAATEKAKADDLANARAVEQRYATIAKESDDALQTQLADARAAASVYADRLRAQASAAGRSVGKPGVPVSASSSSGSVGAGGATELADAQACAAGVIKAEGWRDWYSAVSANEASPAR